MSQVCVPHPWPFLTALREGRFQLPHLTCHPSRSHWGVQMSAQRGRPPPVTAKHSDSHPPGKGRPRTEGGQPPPNPMQKGAAHHRLWGGGSCADLYEVLGLLVLGGLVRDHHHRLNVLGQCRGPQEVGRSLQGAMGGSCSAPRPQEPPLCHPQSPRGARPGTRGPQRARSPEWATGLRPSGQTGTSGSRGIWISRLK